MGTENYVRGGSFADEPMFSEAYLDALLFAAARHRDAVTGMPQVRRGTSIPYISHLMAVSALVWEYGGSETEASAALLHDIVEDTPVTLEEVRTWFGSDVADIVAVASGTTFGAPKPQDQEEWWALKERHIAKVAQAPLRAKFVVCADKVHNLESINRDVAVHGLQTLHRFNGGIELTFAFYQQMALALEGKPLGAEGLTGHPMQDRLVRAVSQLEQAIRG